MKTLEELPEGARSVSGADDLPEPLAPESLEESGLGESQVIDLLLKTLHEKGSITGHALSRAVALPLSILDDVLLTMTQRRFVEVLGTSGHGRGGYRFELTLEGRARAEAALAANRYVGPAPVPLDHFRKWVGLQSVRNHRVPREELKAAFSDLVLPPEVMDALGPAVNSGSSIFLHGAPGNGKTAISERLGSLVSSEIYLPYAVAVDGEIVVLFDSVYHRRVQSPGEDTGGESALVLADSRRDHRFVRVRRPTVFVGGELTMDQLDLQYNPYSRVYQAPFQLKAAGGVLIVDDFGRQRMRPAELLNRWIVPLEKGVDNLTLATGMRFPVPFDCILVFATNLNPRELVDEAFLRRIQFKVEVRSPDREGFERIFRLNCQESGVEYRESAVDLLYARFFDRFRIRPRGCHPRDILHHIRSIAGYEGSAPTLDPSLLIRAAQDYFLVVEEEMQSAPQPIPALGGGLHE